MIQVSKCIKLVYSIFLLVLPFIPLTFIFGDISGFRWTMTGYFWLISILTTVSISYLTLAIAGDFLKKLIDKISLTNSKYLLRSIVPLVFIALYLISYQVFNHRPLLIDTIVQLFQAEIFNAGRLTAKLPPLMEFFVTQHMLFEENGWYGQYPPGHSFILFLGLIIGEPLFFTILLAVATVFIIHKFANHLYGKEVANLSIVLTILSPFFMFMSASYMNHVSTLFLLSSFLYSFALWESSSKWQYLFLAGLSLGLTVTIRPLDGIPCALSVLVPTLLLVYKKPSSLLIGLASMVPGILAFLWYNANTTGDPFTPGYLKLWGAGHEMGFHVNPWGKDHTPLVGLRNELVDLQLLQEMLFEWSIPCLFPVALFLLLPSKLSSWDKRLLTFTVLCPLSYFAYWHRDSFLGPRFEYCTLITWIPLTARAMFVLKEYLSTKSVHPFKLFKPVNLGYLFKFSFLLAGIYAIAFSIPQRLEIYRTSLNSLKVDLKEKAKEAGIHSGLIFVKSSWGVRLMSEMRGRGLSASDTQKAYSFLDHCLLHLTTKDAINNELDATEFSEIVNNFHKTQQRAVTTKINFDPSLKLTRGLRPEPECIDELQYDLKNGEQNYTTYEPHMRANTPNLDGPYIFAKDLRSRNKELMAHYPHLKPYIYDGKGFSHIK